MKSLSFITTHFFDFDWTRLCVQKICRFTPASLICEFLIIDQDRNGASRERLQSLDARARVFQYPKSEPHFAQTGHDHAAVLNAVIREAEGEYLCIIDSDAHPMAATWLDNCERILERHDAVLAQDPWAASLSHPCFMLLKRSHAQLGLAFDDRLFESQIDTGRLVASQLRQANQRVYLAPARRAFGGRWGFIYLDSIYHHGQGSFRGGDVRLKSQVGWQHEYFRKAVINRRSYSLSLLQRCDYSIRALRNRISGRKIIDALRVRLHEAGSNN